MPEFPLLPLPPLEIGEPPTGPRFVPSTPQHPGRARQAARLGPVFDRLAAAFDEDGDPVVLGDDPAGLAPERVIVFEVAGSIRDFAAACTKVLGLEYLAEFLDIVDLSISGSFSRVARMEGLMMPIGVLVIGSTLLFDPSPRRRVLATIALIPIGLALVLTVGRGMWIALAVGLCFLGLLALRDRQAALKRSRRILILVLLPCLVAGMGYLFQTVTRAGVGEIAFARLARVVDYEQDRSIVGRLMSYRIALEEIWKRPLLGGGHGATVTYLVTDPLKSFMLTTGDVDNVYLTILLRMGVVGLVAFVWVFAKGMQMAYRTFQRSDNPGVRLFCASFFAVYGAMLVYGMADNTMMGNRLIFWHAAFLGLLARLEREERAGEKR